MSNVVISASAAGSTELVAAIADKRFRVHSYLFKSAGAVSVKFQSADTDLTGAMPCAANDRVAAAHSPLGHFDCGIGEALSIHLSSAVLVAGHLKYSVIG